MVFVAGDRDVWRAMSPKSSVQERSQRGDAALIEKDTLSRMPMLLDAGQRGDDNVPF